MQTPVLTKDRIVLLCGTQYFRVFEGDSSYDGVVELLDVSDSSRHNLQTWRIRQVARLSGHFDLPNVDDLYLTVFRKDIEDLRSARYPKPATLSWRVAVRSEANPETEEFRYGGFKTCYTIFPADRIDS
jgi:hypothetical protein